MGKMGRPVAKNSVASKIMIVAARRKSVKLNQLVPMVNAKLGDVGSCISKLIKRNVLKRVDVGVYSITVQGMELVNQIKKLKK